MTTAGDRGRDQETSILPELSVRRGSAAVEFYKAAFGAVEDYRVGGRDDDEPVVAQLSVGNASFWVSDESPLHRNFSPESLGGATARVLLVVEDPESVAERGIAAGATERGVVMTAADTDLPRPQRRLSGFLRSGRRAR